MMTCGGMKNVNMTDGSGGRSVGVLCIGRVQIQKPFQQWSLIHLPASILACFALFTVEALGRRF